MDLDRADSTADGTELRWLVGHRFQSLTRLEHYWALAFNSGVTLTIFCLWRLIESGRIRFVSLDEGQQFGLPSPVDAAAEVSHCLSGASVDSAEVRPGLLDLDLSFSSGHIFQVIPDSSGYEAWTLLKGSQQFIAVGGGDLRLWDEPTAN